MKKNPHTNRFNSIKGVVSDREIDFIKNLLPSNNNFKGTISSKELKWLKKRTGAAVTLSELKRLKKLIPNN